MMRFNCGACRSALGLVFYAVLSAAAAATLGAGDRPNIVMIYTDDQAPYAVGVSGYAQARTPHLDRLFREGAYLRNAFVTTPVCSPSRAGLMTSRYGTELGITDWINPRIEQEVGLDPQTVTWPERLAAANYTNGLIGKWHLGTADRFHPTKTGFDYFMGFRAGGTKPRDPLLEVDGREQPLKGFTTEILTDHAIRFVERNKERMFLMCLHFRAPHAPYAPVPDEDWAAFKAMEPVVPNPDYPNLDIPRVQRLTREYLACVACVDRNVGRLLAALDESGLRDKTVVIFTSDHGYNLGHNGVWHKGNATWVLTEFPEKQWPHIERRRRPNMYDTSLRVPAAVRWPGVIRPGTVVTQTISNLDWYPTLLEMAGVPRPGGVTIRGRSFLPLLRGQPLDWDNDLYAEYSMHHGSKADMRMFRTPQWKLVRDFLNKGRDELYDLENDPAERINRIAEPGARVRQVKDELNARILATMKELDDPVWTEDIAAERQAVLP